MKKEFGATKNGEKASCYVLKNSKGMEAVVSDFGASLLKLYVPDKDGKTQDVVLGYETLEDYENGGDSLGATVGRVANRIGMAEFELNGKKYELTKNDNGKNTLHGGIDFYNKRMWDVKEEDDTHVVFALVSPDGDQGFPGEVKIEVSYTITEENELKIHYHAIPDQDTLLNMTNHSYFNLSGHASGTAWNAKVWIDADAFTETDAELIPTGTVVSVEGTPMDFRKEKVVEKEIGADYTPLKLAGGYDHNWVLNHEAGVLGIAGKAKDPASGRVMEAYTDLPGMQFYTANFLKDERPGKGGAHYDRRHAFCFETQYYPDACHKPNFPSPILKAGDTYKTTTIYKFYAE
mgnify:CR=1 FL=1